VAVFVNPYTFVPHVVSPERRAPAGHAVMGDSRFSGVLDVTVTARTPLLIGGFGAEGAEVKGLPRRSDGTVMIPGSGLMGAVRSLHEALTGSCLRVVDMDLRPVHRHPPTTAETDDLVLAVVWEVDAAGRARSVRLCSDWTKLHGELLPGVGGADDDLPRAGDQLSFQPREELKGKAPRGIEAGDITLIRRLGPVSGDCWVLLVTDTNARTVLDKDGQVVAVKFAAGRIGPDGRKCVIPDQAWHGYKTTVAGADDLRTASLKKAGHSSGEAPRWGTCPAEYADVWWPPRGDGDGGRGSGDRGGQERRGGELPEKVGRRLLARPYLHEGQPVWVKVSGDQVTEIRLSQLWRYLGDDPAGERLGDAVPCTDPERLCWSCRMFGSADTGGRGEDDLAVQHSYRGHVRIDDLLAMASVQPIEWRLAPLASPKPGAGQFYLDNTAVPGRERIAEKDTRPAATWGSIADEQRARPVRGRKFYWRTETPAESDPAKPVRGRHRGHQSDTMSTTVSLIPAGTTFTGRVAFDNLDAAEFGSLLAAIDPRLLSEAGEDGWERAATSVGGGKPFGFGSVTIDVTRVSAETSAQRYLGEAGPEPPGDATAVTAFRAAVPAAARAAWPALRHALELGFIEDEKVWYPPGGGERGSQGYDKSFEFFAHTTGLRLGGGRYRDLVVLPDAALPAVKQELDSAAGEHGGRQQAGRGQQGPGQPGSGQRDREAGKNVQAGKGSRPGAWPRPRTGEGPRGEGRDER
jgi:hypothetical protein